MIEHDAGTLPQGTRVTTPEVRELGLLLRIEDVDTIGKSIAFLVQEILLKGFDSVDHADLAARVALILEAMPSARPIVVGMQFAIFDGDYAVALDHARLLVEREDALMTLALARRDPVDQG